MATTVLSAFKHLRAAVEITDLQATVVAKRQQLVRAAIENEMRIGESFLVGSYARNTLIAPLKKADVDIFVVLSSDLFSQYRPGALLDKVRDVLLKTYRTTRVSRNGRAVTIRFTDFGVDVVPAFRRKGGGYLIPDSAKNKWISTNPRIHASTLIEANKRHNDRLVPLVKMMKCWNRRIGHAFSGFYLELLVIDALKSMAIPDDPSGMRLLFELGREKVRYAQLDPAGMGGQVFGLVNASSVEVAVSRFTTAYEGAVAAERLDRAGWTSGAYAEWGKIFGNSFPSYG